MQTQDYVYTKSLLNIIMTFNNAPIQQYIRMHLRAQHALDMVGKDVQIPDTEYDPDLLNIMASSCGRSP